MTKTYYEIKGKSFYINGKITYHELPNKSIQGLLFNTRFIQGVFDDKNPEHKGFYDRFGKVFDPEKNTDELIDSLQDWYDGGIRAITVGLQGGGPILSYENWNTIDTGSFSPDGKVLNNDYLKRLTKLIKACDEIGMLIIVSILYQAQAHLLRDGLALVEAVKTVSRELSKLEYSNVIIEVANEYDVGDFNDHPIISSSEGMATLINIAREASDNKFAVGASGGGGIYDIEVIENSDIILIHGNDLTRQRMYNFINKVKEICNDKPIVCNEDSQMFSQLEVAIKTYSSWGYFNAMTKQEPPTPWGITRGEDEYFIKRLKDYLGIENAGKENEYYLQGFEKDYHIDGKRFIKFSSLYPEKINYVEFFEDDKLIYTSFAEPFMLYNKSTWAQRPYIANEGASEFKACAHLHNGEIVILKEKI